MDRNIVIVVSAMNMGGAQTVVSILSNYWSKNGYRITLISTFSGERTNHYKLSKNVVLKYLSDNPFSVKRLNPGVYFVQICKEKGYLDRMEISYGYSDVFKKIITT